ncbi:MAG: beta-propeller fold lactonase family protein, partial [Myxococcota bacterium]|nr:beta-propeller fold lactonase family protein [Myxococcota bacterium]
DTDKVLDLLPTDYYAIEAEFTPDGKELWVSNRWRDAVSVWPMDGTPDSCHDESVPVGSNPRDLAMSPDGETIAVAALTGMTVSLVDRASRTERQRIAVGAPVNGLAFAGEYLVVATLSASTHHRPLAGPDTNNDGVPGDGTPNVNFQDLQNELAVFDAGNGDALWRYTSDTIAYHDYRDVDPTDSVRDGDLLAPTSTWIVGGALPEQIAAHDDGANVTVYVSYSASNEVQPFALDPATGALSPGPVWATTDHNPHGLAVAGDDLLVAHRLGETLGRYDRFTGESLGQLDVGDLSGGAFPATDAELGELINFVTAPFTVDGDTSCAHCHREDGNIDKFFSMPLTRYAGVG